ncbi:MAG TPA: HAMP domain-containing sensor histidine kinase [Candidatus Paceibacterota bacterium]|nr:HAMP domain-containing sensor histidine kinase [Verrucomicrobiota bacterium]HRY47002.1 HAMP domain-containing sensor histidine kinase [Candidatus Paceibacterota bacterium]HRZ99098.1 HAMP domain-containing sensor histidine kinase [Candidatus Paceibacterota bacterium]
MSISNRIILWFSAILVFSLALMAAVFHYELRETRQRMRSGLPLDSALEETGEFLLYYGLPASLLLLLGGGWMLRRSLRPILRLTEVAENLHLNRLDQRLPPVGTGDEIDRLIEVFNAMTARLQASFEQARDFTLHASHELKTPLTIMQGELETAMASDTLTKTQRETLGSLLDEVQRLTHIVESLTFLAKADAGLLPLASDPVRLDELVRESYADAQVLARPRMISVALTACEEVSVRGDRHRLRQLLLNLMDNAVKYNELRGRVDIALRHDGDAAQLTIANTGPGIASEKLLHVFDRFFRGDPAHGSAVEGCGLGLAIAQWVVEAHGGTIEFASQPGQLTTVRVRLPAHA